MPTTPRQDHALFVAFCSIVGCAPTAITKPEVLKQFFEATKAQQLAALKARVQLMRNQEQIDHDTLDDNIAAQQARLAESMAELDALLALGSL